MLKLIVWDLDDTLWRGTLADGDAVEPFAHRIDLVRAFTARGVVSSICSKKDPAAAEALLRTLGWWDEFVFPRIDFAPKPTGVAGSLPTCICAQSFWDGSWQHMAPPPYLVYGAGTDYLNNPWHEISRGLLDGGTV